MLTRSIPNLILLRESLYTFSTVSTEWLTCRRSCKTGLHKITFSARWPPHTRPEGGQLEPVLACTVFALDRSYRGVRSIDGIYGVEVGVGVQSRGGVGVGAKKVNVLLSSWLSTI